MFALRSLGLLLGALRCVLCTKCNKVPGQCSAESRFG